MDFKLCIELKHSGLQNDPAEIVNILCNVANTIEQAKLKKFQHGHGQDLVASNGKYVGYWGVSR